MLVSEVMLQQTQVTRVLEPYARFVERFPTPEACAAAGTAEVVRAWHGLGYNRRAVFLHRAAEEIVARHAGRVPRELSELLALPGIGAYTARAVQAFAFEIDTGVVETNTARILARAVAGRVLDRRGAQALADWLVPPGRSWAFNQALFDLGTRHCTAPTPDCNPCPLRASCAWASRGHGTPDPASGSAGISRGQARFAGSDRQGRGRLVAALRAGSVSAHALAATAGWPGDPARARRVAGSLVREGLARWGRGGGLELG